MDDLISIIVPIYKVEKYLDKCVQSIVSQTYTNLEIILVDDGSPDRCGQMCDTWAERDSRIRVIHKVNGGLSDARNAGIDASHGDYLMFIDSDDYISPVMAEKMLETLVETDSDCVSCYIEIVGAERPVVSGTEVMILGKVEALRELSILRGGFLWVSACNKLFKRELFTDLRFPVGKIHEDQYIMHHVFYACNRVAIIPEYYYYIVQNEESITRAKKTIKRLDDIDAVYDRAIFYEEKGLQELLPGVAELIILRYEELYFSIEDHSPEAKKRFKDARKKTWYTYFKYASPKKGAEVLSLVFPGLFKILSKNRVRSRIKGLFHSS